MVLMAADERLTDTVEEDLANAALILASDIADGSNPCRDDEFIEVSAQGALHRRRDDRMEIRFAGESEDGTFETCRRTPKMSAYWMKTGSDRRTVRTMRLTRSEHRDFFI
jgi:hypothetical protein